MQRRLQGVGPSARMLRRSHRRPATNSRPPPLESVPPHERRLFNLSCLNCLQKRQIAPLHLTVMRRRRGGRVGSSSRRRSGDLGDLSLRQSRYSRHCSARPGKCTFAKSSWLQLLQRRRPARRQAAEQGAGWLFPEQPPSGRSPSGGGKRLGAVGTGSRFQRFDPPHPPPRQVRRVVCCESPPRFAPRKRV